MSFSVRQRLILGGGVIYLTSAAGMFLYLKSETQSKQTSICTHCGSYSSSIFDAIASKYDEEINLSESLMLLNVCRSALLKHATGTVLEIGSGTGRNLKYYPITDDTSKIEKLYITDISKEMVKQAWEKWRELSHSSVSVVFKAADSRNLCYNANVDNDINNSVDGYDTDLTVKFGPQIHKLHQFPPHSMDTVVQTFGLCSVDDPIKVLKEMARITKPGGKILMLEHGKGHWGFVNNILDSGVEQHFEKWGCRWNKNILGLIEEAGLEVEKVWRWHFGTTYYIIARAPGKKAM